MNGAIAREIETLLWLYFIGNWKQRFVLESEHPDITPEYLLTG